MKALLPAVLLLAVFAAPCAAGEVLWEKRAASAPCRLSVDLPAGSRLEVHAGAAEDSRLSGDPGLWVVAAGENGESTTLTLSRAAGGEPAALRLELAAGCRPEVRSASSPVEFFGLFPAGLAAASTTGDLTLWVEEGQRATLQAATSGELMVDFTVELTYYHHREPAKVGLVELGPPATGDHTAPRMELSSRQGAVRVLHPSSRPLLSPATPFPSNSSQSQKELPP